MLRFAAFLLLACTYVRAADWPQLLGPERNGISPETNLAPTWPKEGPRTAWKFKVGQGWSGPVVSSNRVFLFHRIADKETLHCLSATNGAVIWQAEHPTTYRDDFGFDEGPRATPVIDGNRIFTFGANGMLSAWSTSSGSNVWRVDTRAQFKSDKGFFGIACSPLVEGNSVILNIGGKDGAGIVAFDKASGKTLWKATAQEASYSSPVSADFGGKRCTLVLGRSALVALDPSNGAVAWEHAFEPGIRASVSAATPLVIGDKIFISASYGAGAALSRFAAAKPDVLWSGDDILSNHYSTSLHHGGFLYGFDGRQEQRCHLRCVELETGKVRWSEERFGAGNMIGAGERLLILTERGELICATAAPDKFTVLARAQVLGADCRAAPALAHGRFYGRDKSTLICVDLGAK